MIPCIIGHKNNNKIEWAVVSPLKLIQIAMTKKRGQHTKIAFESMQIQWSTKIKEEYGCCENNLGKKIIEVTQENETDFFKDISNKMIEFKTDLSELNAKYKDIITSLFNKYDK